jgi:hypothetical protein
MNDEAEPEKLLEADRKHRIAAIAVAIAATLVAALLYWGTTIRSSPAEPLLATLIALALVTGLRGLEVPTTEVHRRRSGAPSTSRGDLVKLWLACFLALEAAFLVTDLSINSRHSRLAAESMSPNVALSGKLTIIDGARRQEVLVSGHAVADPADQGGNRHEEQPDPTNTQVAP